MRDMAEEISCSVSCCSSRVAEGCELVGKGTWGNVYIEGLETNMVYER